MLDGLIKTYKFHHIKYIFFSFAGRDFRMDRFFESKDGNKYFFQRNVGLDIVYAHPIFFPHKSTYMNVIVWLR